MTTTIFFFCAVAAVIAIFAMICIIANCNYLSKAGLALAVLFFITVAVLLGWAYVSLPDQSCGCANIWFTLIEIGIALIILLAILQMVGKYIIGIAEVVGVIFLLRWLFINGVAEGSLFGAGISLWVVGFSCFCGLGLILWVKRALK